MWPAFMWSARETMEALNPSTCAGVRMGCSNHAPTMASATQPVLLWRLPANCHAPTMLHADGNETAHEVKPTLEQPSERRTIETQSLATIDFTESNLAECILPLPRRPVRVAQRYSVADIAHPVHQSKPLVTEP